MEEDPSYATVIFTAKSEASTLKKPNEGEIIYDEVKPVIQTAPIIPEAKEKKPPSYSCLHLVAAGLGIICGILVLVIIILSIQFQTELSEQLRANSNLTAQTERLKDDLQRQIQDLQIQTQELTRERDGLNWTLEVILEYKTFPVDDLCKQKVCKPCLDNWVLFQSNCYLFSKPVYSSNWLWWDASKEECQKFNANLVVIESKEEQEFINNQTEKYNDENHGYWIGLKKKDQTEDWRWLDGSNLTLNFWREQQGVSGRQSCALTSPHGVSQAKWQKTVCSMKNRFICKTRALTKQAEESEALT